MSRPKVIAIVGPTSSGKSELAAMLAKNFSGEIISADSRQVYRGLDIGTGKVPISYERSEFRKSSIQPPQKRGWGVAMYYKGIRHHLLDVASPRRQFTVAQYQKLARCAIEDIANRGKIPILCGGTGLYVDAALYDFPIPSVKPNKKLRKKLEALSAETLFKILKLKDPARAHTIDRYNKRRLVRALEIVETTGKAIPSLDAYYGHPRYDILKIGIAVPPKQLRQKIRARLAARFRRGMIHEVLGLLAKKEITPKRLEELGLEYRYIGRYLEGNLTKEKARDELENEIARYAKRQMTWLKRDRNTVWIKNKREAERAIRVYLGISGNRQP